MKKLIFAIAVVIATVGFAKAVVTKANSKSVKATVVAEVHCYTMNDKGMMICYAGGAQTPMKTDVRLSNGTTISSTGMVTPKGGRGTQLAVGQCVDLNGVIASYSTHK